MDNLPAPRTKNPHEKTWDHHGSYQWTYFADHMKHRVDYFLAKRLHGKNLDVGGGWYCHYPNSTVLDLSSVCLSHNPAKRKIQFDLDELGRGKRLPLRDHAFDSATLVSVWQYLRHPMAVMKELERVLKPGAEAYIINGQGAGLEECVVGAKHASAVKGFLTKNGYDSFTETIPTPQGGIDEFLSVCVAMPDIDLFGAAPSKVCDKERRVALDEHIRKEPASFNEGYAAWEYLNITKLLAQLRTYPVTAFSEQYKKRVEAFSDEYRSTTGRVPIIFSDHDIEPAFATRTSDEQWTHSTITILGNERDSDTLPKIMDKHDIHFSQRLSYFKENSIDAILASCSKLRLDHVPDWDIEDRHARLRSYTGFIATLPLTNQTRELQHAMRDALAQNIKNIDERINEHRAAAYYHATYSHKQRRTIDELIERKKKIQKEHTPIVRTAQLDYVPFLNELWERILNEGREGQISDD